MIAVPSKRTYNRAGNTARDHYQSGDDPCGYVVDNPCPYHESINDNVGEAMQLVEQVREQAPDTVATALRVYNLARELASKAGRMPAGELPLLSAQVSTVVRRLYGMANVQESSGTRAD